MQSASRSVRIRTAARHAMGAAGALALVAVATACTPDSPGAAPTPVGRPATSTGAASPTVEPVTPPTSSTPTPVSTTPAAPATPSTPAGPTDPATPTSAPTTPAPAPTTAAPKPQPAPVVLLEAGDTGSKVRSLQARLRQIGWFAGDVSDLYGSRTTEAVRGFQAKRGFDATGRLDERTWDKLVAMTHRPTSDELANVKPKPPTPKPEATSWDVDERCLTGRVMCVSKTTRHLTWVVDGVPQYGFDVRFGSDELPTREGVFSVYKKKVDVISNLYHTPMPYSMFFSGGQAVHYSSNFARLGYSGASHGCVNVRNKPLLVQLYGEVRLGDKVVVHW
ncbi:L,D-transpeptidase family protein [Terrabacter sp. NPDC000476]|uniref:L,D-transpeptidase family protein n=1 Tax=Terrabacter sp. NPDC000476 TaxID=3154258 RepID=UPI00333242F7